MTTNALSARAAVRVADLQEFLGSAARFVQFTTRMSGRVQGGIVRGDHVKQLTVLAGNVNYDTMVRKSFDILTMELANPGFLEELMQTMDEAGYNFQEIDYRDAIYGKVHGRKGLLTSLRQSLGGTNPDYTCEGVYEPLVLDGEVIPCAKVYVSGKPSIRKDAGAPVRGAIYFNGVTINSKIIEPSQNGDILPANKGPVAVIKEFTEDWLALPIRNFRTFRLLPGTPFKFQCGNFTASGA